MNTSRKQQCKGASTPANHTHCSGDRRTNLLERGRQVEPITQTPHPHRHHHGESATPTTTDNFQTEAAATPTLPSPTYNPLPSSTLPDLPTIPTTEESTEAESTTSLTTEVCCGFRMLLCGM